MWDTCIQISPAAAAAAHRLAGIKCMMMHRSQRGQCRSEPLYVPCIVKSSTNPMHEHRGCACLQPNAHNAVLIALAGSGPTLTETTGRCLRVYGDAIPLCWYQHCGRFVDPPRQDYCGQACRTTHKLDSSSTPTASRWSPSHPLRSSGLVHTCSTTSTHVHLQPMTSLLRLVAAGSPTKLGCFGSTT